MSTMNTNIERTHHSSTKRRNLRQHIEEFSGNTTFHGVQFVLGADRGILRRIFWLLLIMTGLGFLTKQLVVSYEKLQEKEHVTTKEISTENRLKFPAVTICNANMLKKSKIEGTDAKVYLDQLNPFKTGLQNMTLNKSFHVKKAVQRYGHNDLIRDCAWDGKLCSPLNFTIRFSQRYGLCHTFNSGQAGHPLLYSTSVKRTQGLIMLINIDTDEYYGITSYFNTGIRMVIHDQDDEPMVEVNGIDVAPGHVITMKIQRTKYISLPPPYQSACGSRNLKTSEVYTRSKCLMECSARKILQKCGCKILGMPDLPEFNGSKYCTPNEMIACGVFVSGGKRYGNDTLFKLFIAFDSPYSTDNPEQDCDCPINCTHIQYKITQINYVPLCSESLTKELWNLNDQASKQELSNFRENNMVLIIHYDDLCTHKTAERKAYDINDFGSDVGGYLGLFLGCSILTVFEIFDFIINFLFGKSRNVNRVEEGDEKNECKPTESIS